MGRGLVSGPQGPGHGVGDYDNFDRIRQEAAAQDRVEGIGTDVDEMEDIADGTIEVSAEDLRVMMEIEEGDDLPIVVDVRTDEEWKGGHIEGALHVPVDALDERMNDIDRQRLVVLYCQSGMRSIDGSYVLKRHGYPRVRSLAGGIAGWQEAGNGLVVPKA